MFAKYSQTMSKNSFESVFAFSSLIIIVEGNLALFVKFLKSIMSLIMDQVRDEFLLFFLLNICSSCV